MYKNQISFKLMKKFSGSSAGEKEDLSKKEDFENNKSSKGNLKKMDNSKFSYEYPMTYLVLITKEFLRKFLLE